MEIAGARRQLGLISFSVILAAGGLLVYSTRRMVIKPVKGLLEAMTSVASGDLTRDVIHSAGDEIGEMGKGLNRVILNLRGMIGKIQHTSDAVAKTSGKIVDDSRDVVDGSHRQASSLDNIGSTMEEMNVSIAEIARNTEVLASSAADGSSSMLELDASIRELVDSAEALFASVDETTSSILEMSASVKEVSENTEVMSASAVHVASSMTEMDASIKAVESNAKETAELADGVIGDAHVGMAAVEKTIQGIGKIKGLTQEAGSIINGFSKRTDEIGKILKVIKDVADETNLLSLNAAIIAAQAGVHGKGFAVVAEEIKALAERTTGSTKEVAELIEAIQSDGIKAVKAMETSQRGVEEGIKLSHEAGETLNKIVESAAASTDKVKGIARAALEQAGGVHQAMEAVEKLAQMAQRIVTATREQSRGIEHISNAAERMRETASRVKVTTKGQAEANKQITKTIEEFVSMVERINQAVKEQNIGSGQILKAIEEVRGIAKGNVEKVKATSASVEMMTGQATALMEDVGRFKL